MGCLHLRTFSMWLFVQYNHFFISFQLLFFYLSFPFPRIDVYIFGDDEPTLYRSGKPRGGHDMISWVTGSHGYI